VLRWLQENERLAAEVEAMRSSPSSLAEARAKHQEHLSDRDKFRKLLDNLQVGQPLFGSPVLAPSVLRWQHGAREYCTHSPRFPSEHFGLQTFNE
jgi:hypothetical protein